MEIERKLEKLNNIIYSKKKIAVAFSGGVDSTFLLMIAKSILMNNVLSIIVRSSFFSDREYSEAIEFVKEYDIKYKVLDINIFKDEISNNPPDRCYWCKRRIFECIKSASLEEDISFVTDGSNADDLKDYRPGLKALEELEIISPLKEAGLNKQEIRILSYQMGLKTWHKPSFACLASRFPYGQKITKEKLLMVDKAEQYLMDIGFKQIRVRHHGDIARIEVGTEERRKFFKDEILDKVYSKFKEIGFMYTALDLKGYRTGSLNEVIIK